MRKKVCIVCVLVVVIMVLAIVGSYDKIVLAIGSALTEENGTNKLEFEEKGIYVKLAFGQEFYVYLFAEPNSTIVVYETLDGIFVIGEKASEKGISYGDVFMPEWKFIALSNKYLLFETEEGKIAVGLEKKKNVKPGEDLYNKYSYDELSDAEKDAFVYPVEQKKIKR